MKREIVLNDIASPAVNILNLRNSEEFACHIYKYEPWSLSVAAYSSRQILYLTFGDIRYMEGPFRWKGANLCVAPDSDYIKTLSQIEDIIKIEEQNTDSLPNITMHSTTLPGKLFVIPCTLFQIKILANFLSVSDTPNDS